MPFEQFDRSRLKLRPLAERAHELDRSCLIFPDSPREPFEHEALPLLAERIVRASREGRAVIFCCGAHVLRKGNGPLLIDLMERGLLGHVALNGAGAIHDFEMAMIGHTCESVARYVAEGQFGLWQETGRFNDAARQGYLHRLGLGEALGRYILREKFPHQQESVLAAGTRLGVPITVHVGIGLDIVHEHPNCDGAMLGATSYTDFLVFTQSVTRLEGGVYLNLGTAVTGPEVFLKALSMARYAAHQDVRSIKRFTTAVFDLVELGEDLHGEAPDSDPRYYFRPYKTVLVRTVGEGGSSHYVRGDHARTVPALYDQILAKANG